MRTLLFFTHTLATLSQDTLPFISEDNCSVSFPTINTSFNICNLKLPNGFGERDYYSVKDYRYDIPTSSGQYHYHFNIGAPVLNMEEICINATYNEGWCPAITFPGRCGTDLIPITGPSYAYQLRNSSSTHHVDDCWRLSSENGGPPEWSLTYAANPAEGVTLSYLNGDFTHDGACPQNRQFNIEFLCEDEFLNVPDEETLHEFETCQYTLQIKSIYGCPVECKRYNEQLCNGQGLCGYDFSNTRPRCFCYHNYDGDDCSTLDTSQSAPTPPPSKPVPTGPTAVVHTLLDDTVYGNIDEEISITYDLTPMALNGAAYAVSDSSMLQRRQYYIGVTQAIDRNKTDLPDSCWLLSNETAPCAVFGEGIECADYDMTDYNAQTYAFEYNLWNGECVRLGTAWNVKFYDTVEDPARGITIDYVNGSYCSDLGVNRALRVSLVCPDDDEEFTVPDINEDTYVSEDTEADCRWSLEIRTAIACPYQCRTSMMMENGTIDYSVCSEHGICGADPNAGFVRCLCDEGWKGVECQHVDSESPSSSPTLTPTGLPTKSPVPTPEPTPLIRIYNATTVRIEESSAPRKEYTVIIVLLCVALVACCAGGYTFYKRFKQREALMQTELDEYRQMGSSNVKHDVTVKSGLTSFSTIDDHIEKDKRDDNGVGVEQ